MMALEPPLFRLVEEVDEIKDTVSQLAAQLRYARLTISRILTVNWQLDSGTPG